MFQDVGHQKEEAVHIGQVSLDNLPIRENVSYYYETLTIASRQFLVSGIATNIGEVYGAAVINLQPEKRTAIMQGNMLHCVEDLPVQAAITPQFVAALNPSIGFMVKERGIGLGTVLYACILDTLFSAGIDDLYIVCDLTARSNPQSGEITSFYTKYQSGTAYKKSGIWTNTHVSTKPSVYLQGILDSTVVQ